MVLKNAGTVSMGIGVGTGDNRAIAAANAALSSPLLDSSIEGARGVLLNITGPSDIGLFEVNAAAEIVRAVTHPDANIIFGAAVDDELEDEIRVTVIAAGFDRSDSPTKPVQRPTTGPTDTKGQRIRELFGSDETGDARKLDIPDFLK